MAWKQTYTTFRPADAERITGVSRDMQRSLRKREFLPQGDGWAAYDVRALAELYVIGCFARTGVGPKAAAQIAPTASLVVRYRAVHLPGAIEDPAGLRGDEPLIRLPPPDVRRPERNFPMQRFLVVFEGGQVSYTDDPVQALGERRADVALVLDLDRIAALILERAGGPLVRIAEAVEA